MLSLLEAVNLFTLKYSIKSHSSIPLWSNGRLISRIFLRFFETASQPYPCHWYCQIGILYTLKCCALHSHKSHMDLSSRLSVISPCYRQAAVLNERITWQRSSKVAKTSQGSTDFITASHFLSVAGKAAWMRCALAIISFCLQLFLLRMHLCIIKNPPNIYQAFCSLFSDPKKLPVIFQSHCQISTWLFFNIRCNCVNTFAERALLACADRLEFKISTVIIFHRLLVHGKFHLACEFACSEIGQRSRWLWKKKRNKEDWESRLLFCLLD